MSKKREGIDKLLGPKAEIKTAWWTGVFDGVVLTYYFLKLPEMWASGDGTRAVVFLMLFTWFAAYNWRKIGRNLDKLEEKDED